MAAQLAAFSTGKYNGRDKFAKCLQFGSKFLAYRMLLNDPDNEFAKKLVLLTKQLAISRKGLRLFKSIEEYQKLQVALAKKKAPIDLLLDITTTTGMMFRWAYDNLAFLEKTKILDKSNYGITSNKFRVIATVAYIIGCIRTLLKANAAAAAAKAEDAEKANAVRFEAALGLFARCHDIICAVHGAGYYKTNDGVQGYCGFISSAIALRKVIKAMK